MVIKLKFAFSNNCCKELLKLISDVLLANHKLPRGMYQSKKLLSSLGMDYEKIDICQENYMFFDQYYQKCLLYLGQSNQCVVSHSTNHYGSTW
jgi:hypothetical protein